MIPQYPPYWTLSSILLKHAQPLSTIVKQCSDWLLSTISCSWEALTIINHRWGSSTMAHHHSPPGNHDEPLNHRLVDTPSPVAGSRPKAPGDQRAALIVEGGHILPANNHCESWAHYLGHESLYHRYILTKKVNSWSLLWSLTIGIS